MQIEIFIVHTNDFFEVELDFHAKGQEIIEELIANQIIEAREDYTLVIPEVEEVINPKRDLFFYRKRITGPLELRTADYQAVEKPLIHFTLVDLQTKQEYDVQMPQSATKSEFITAMIKREILSFTLARDYVFRIRELNRLWKAGNLQMIGIRNNFHLEMGPLTGECSVMQQIVRDHRDLIKDAQTTQLIGKLQELLNEQGIPERFGNKLILIQGRFQHLKRSNMLGTVPQEEYFTIYNQINADLLGLLDDLERLRL
ncbi:MAG: hypothetical protein AAF206_15130 [Bacteroidota bacterium]